MTPRMTDVVLPPTFEQTASFTPGPKTARDYARELYEGGMRCNCDLDNWEPERSTGHSQVCRIHGAAIVKAKGGAL